MTKFTVGDKVRITIKDPKVCNTPGIVTEVSDSGAQVVLELWSRWGTFSEYFPLWLSNDQLELIPGSHTR